MLDFLIDDIDCWAALFAWFPAGWLAAARAAFLAAWSFFELVITRTARSRMKSATGTKIMAATTASVRLVPRPVLVLRFLTVNLRSIDLTRSLMHPFRVIITILCLSGI